ATGALADSADAHSLQSLTDTVPRSAVWPLTRRAFPWHAAAVMRNAAIATPPVNRTIVLRRPRFEVCFSFMMKLLSAHLLNERGLHLQHGERRVWGRCKTVRNDFTSSRS